MTQRGDLDQASAHPVGAGAARLHIDWRPNACSCGSTECRFVYLSLDHFDKTDEVGRVFRCASCGSLFPDRFPTVDTLHAAYENYYTQPSSRKLGLVASLLRRIRRGYFCRHTPADTRRLLDYGCGSGEFAAQSRAPERFVTDINIVHGPFTWLSLDDVRRSSIPFDWITLGHVLEHLPHPDATLRLVASKLASRGGIWIATPNANGFLIRAFKGLARDIDFPRHRQVYTRRALTEALQRHGLSPTYVRPPRINALLNFIFCAKLALRSRAKSNRYLSIISGGLRLCFYLILPRPSDDPELIAIARRTHPEPTTTTTTVRAQGR